ncbi:MAG: AAC(3) family N-acetyltransferase [Microthrixaceae bacterium]
MSAGHDVEAIVAGLVALGVVPGDTVMVHASLRAVGPGDGGAEGLIGALDRAVAPSGTTLMVLGAEDEWAWVNDRPEQGRAALLAEAKPFDARTTPAEADVGALAEVFRTQPGTVVNEHPEGRFGARGAAADELVAEPPWDDYYGPGSPLERLVNRRGKVLRLGADPDTVTLLHYAEYLADVPDKRRVRRHRKVLGPSGPQIRTVECLDDCNGIVDHPGEDYFATILTAYLRTGRATTGTVGHATAELLDAADLVSFATDWMNANLHR